MQTIYAVHSTFSAARLRVRYTAGTGDDVLAHIDLTIEPGGYLYANGGGPDMNINRDVVSFHGGQSAGASGNKAYDSVFAPRLPGYVAEKAAAVNNRHEWCFGTDVSNSTENTSMTFCVLLPR